MGWGAIHTMLPLLGVTSSRIQPTGWLNPQGDYAYCLGSDTPGFRTIVTIGSDDSIGIAGAGHLSDGKTLRIRAHARGPDQVPSLVRVTSSATATYTVTIDGVDYAYAATASEGVLQIAHALHQLIVADDDCPCYAQINFPGDTVQLDAKDAQVPYTLAVTGNLESGSVWWVYKVSLDEGTGYTDITFHEQTIRPGYSRERYDTGVMVANMDKTGEHDVRFELELRSDLTTPVADVELPALYLDEVQYDHTLPTDLDGCVLWLDAALGFWPPADAANITRLHDHSGNGNHATHGVDATLTGPAYDEDGSANSTPVVVFDGTNDELYVADDPSLEPNTGSWLFIAYMQFTAGSGSEKAVCGKDTSAGGTGFRCLRTSGGTLQVSWGSDAEDYTASTATVADSSWHLLGWGVDASTNEAIYIKDGTVERKSITVQGVGVNGNDLTIGGDSTSGLRAAITVAEFAMYSRGATEGFSSTELAALWSYFNEKY